MHKGNAQNYLSISSEYPGLSQTVSRAQMSAPQKGTPVSFFATSSPSCRESTGQQWVMQAPPRELQGSQITKWPSWHRWRTAGCASWTLSCCNTLTQCSQAVCVSSGCWRIQGTYALRMHVLQVSGDTTFLEKHNKGENNIL